MKQLLLDNSFNEKVANSNEDTLGKEGKEGNQNDRHIATENRIHSQSAGYHSDTFFTLKYNQQNATFSRPIYFCKWFYTFQAIPPPIIRSTKLYIQRQVLSNQYCCLPLPWMRRNAVSSHPRCMYSFVLLMMGGGTA